VAQPEERRLQLTGGSTYIVSLPKWWINGMDLKKGDAVVLMPQPGGGLLIVPTSMSRRGQRSGALDVPALEDRDNVARKLLAMYLAGYDTIEIHFSGTEIAESRSYLKGIIRRKLIGVEIIEESQDSMVARCLLRYSELPLKSIIERMHILSSLMMKDALRAVLDDDRALADDVISRDDDIDRLYFLSVRQLKSAISNPAVAGEIGLRSLREALGYRLISKSLERIADHTTGIAQAAFLIGKFPEQLSDELSEFSSISLNVVDDAVRALNSMDERMALRAISLTQDVVKYEDRLSNEAFGVSAAAISVAGIRLMLESVRRIAEYGSDIAEVVLNMIADSSMGEPAGQ